MKITIDLSELEVTTDLDTPETEGLRRFYEDVTRQLLHILIDSTEKDVGLTVEIKQVP